MAGSTLLSFCLALELGFLQEFPLLSKAAKGTCLICNQKKKPSAEAIPPRSVFGSLPLCTVYRTKPGHVCVSSSDKQSSPSLAAML